MSFDWNLLLKVLQSLLFSIVVVVVPVITRYVVGYIKTKRAEKILGIEDAKGNFLLTKALDILQMAVETVSQTFVDSLKAAGSFEQAKKDEALEKAVDLTTRLMSVEVKNYIKENYNDIGEWIKTQIEAYIRRQKTEKEIASATIASFGVIASAQAISAKSSAPRASRAKKSI